MRMPKKSYHEFAMIGYFPTEQYNGRADYHLPAWGSDKLLKEDGRISLSATQDRNQVHVTKYKRNLLGSGNI